MILVGVTGYRRAGKNSVANVLAEYGFRLYGFADALRTLAVAVNPLIDLTGAPEDIERAMGRGLAASCRYTDLLRVVGYERAKEVPDMRAYLQKLGTEGIRSTFGPNAWVDALAQRFTVEQPERAVITDVRFMNEAAFVRERGVLWRIIRPGVGGSDPHPSEVDIPNLPAHRELVARDLTELRQVTVAALAADLDLDAEEAPHGGRSPQPHVGGHRPARA
jgi:hypothetical protein